MHRKTQGQTQDQLLGQDRLREAMTELSFATLPSGRLQYQRQMLRDREGSQSQ